MRMRRTTSALAGLLLAGTVGAPAAYARSARPEQWHLAAMQAEQMWKFSTGLGVTVAVIDTGVGRIPELDGQVVQGKDFSHGYEGDERTDYGDHGTGIAALIAGTGKRPTGGGAFGLAPGAKILPLRVSEGGGNLRLHQSIAEAIRFAADSDAKVLNISFGGPGESEELDAAVRYALDKGKLIFSSVGNDGDGPNEVMYPSGSPGVVGVSAVGPDDAATKESQHGPQVDLAAPGVDIVTGCADETDSDPGPDSGFCSHHGTSDATALASASVALLWSVHPDWTNNQVLRVLLNTAAQPVGGGGRDDYVGYGVVRPRIALLAAPASGDPDPGPGDLYPLPDLAGAQGRNPPSPPADGKSSGLPALRAEAGRAGRSVLPRTLLGWGASAVVGAAVAAVVVRRVCR
ncbi:type VII secretion-associated serine protease mycosin [Streptomyces sp. NPDC006430]|uniref:type VII secretion-associated serine protease mycosin n=1 Tax=Streptomyces sp. NPDC006430 TaxID=3154299 RepID=UPI0033B2E09C